MPFTLPDKGEGQNDIQSILFQEYLDILLAGINGVDCVLSGGACTAQGSPNMTVAVAKAATLSNKLLKATAAANATIGAADATNPRIDLVVINSSGAIATRAGTAAAAPKPPARTANDVVLCAVYVPANDTTIATDQITDMRVIREVGPITIACPAPFSYNTSLAITTLATVTIPDGLFLTGRHLRLRAGGNYLMNSGTATFTYTISFGGTVMFADATAAGTADADRGAWAVDLDLHAASNTAQTLGGFVAHQTPGPKTAPTTGTAGDLAVVTHVGPPIRGTAAVDSNAGNRDLLLRMTMSVSNVADEFVMDWCCVELI